MIQMIENPDDKSLEQQLLEALKSDANHCKILERVQKAILDLGSCTGLDLGETLAFYGLEFKNGMLKLK